MVRLAALASPRSGRPVGTTSHLVGGIDLEMPARRAGIRRAQAHEGHPVFDYESRPWVRQPLTQAKASLTHSTSACDPANVAPIAPHSKMELWLLRCWRAFYIAAGQVFGMVSGISDGKPSL
jgi:hypothetical protein